MFEWNSKMYMDEKVRKNPAKYKKILGKKKVVRECYVLTMPLNEKNCFDLYSSREFLFSYYQKQTIRVVGLAVSRESAEELLCQMLADIYRKYGNVDAKMVHQYFEEA